MIQIWKNRLALPVVVILIVGLVVTLMISNRQRSPQLAHKAPKAGQTGQITVQQPFATGDSAPALTVGPSDQTMQANPSVETNQSSAASVQPSASVPNGGNSGYPQATDPSTTVSSPPATYSPPINQVYKPTPIQPPYKGGCAPAGPPGTLHPDYCIVTAD